jgi:hypothetical protein
LQSLLCIALQRPLIIGYATIGILSDEVLLEIFAFYLCGDEYGDEEEWQTLVHVCRRWRSIVFGSPLSLNLRIVCADETCNEALDIWPAFPIIIRIADLNTDLGDNLLTAFKQRDRICEIHIDNVSDDWMDELELVMKGPFPALTVLDIQSGGEQELLLSDSFLGGSAPSLRSLYLQGIGYRALPKLLSSAPGLVRLHLVDIPDWYFPPEAMVDSLSSLTRLEQLELHFHFAPRSNHASRRLPPLTRTVLPVLTSLAFRGEGEYLDHLFAHTHFPQLNDVDITFCPPVIFDVSQISRFIGHTEAFEVSDQAHILFNRDVAEVTVSSSKGATDDTSLRLSIRCRDSVFQLNSLKWACRPFPPRFPTHTVRLDHLGLPAQSITGNVETRWRTVFQPFTAVENLYLVRTLGVAQSLSGNVETRWQTVFQPFTAVENLYLNREIAEYVIFALQEHTAEQGVVTELFPALQSIFIESLESVKSGPAQEAIEKFVAARELSGRPVTVQHWLGK